MAMQLTPEERNIIVSALEAKDRNLLKLISRTKQAQPRDALTTKEHLVGSLIQRFEAEGAPENFTDLWW